MNIGGGGAVSLDSDTVTCSICLESVTGTVEKSTTRLQCGHQFHLDCIGSEFNAKGRMQCPNCREVEKGNWLYASGFQSSPEHSLDGLPFYGLPYISSIEMLVQEVIRRLCLFDRLDHVHSLFEELEGHSPSVAYHDNLFRHYPFVEHPSPYLQLLQPSATSLASRRSSGDLVNGSFYQHQNHWGHIPQPNNNMQFHTWEQHQSLHPVHGSYMNMVDGLRSNPDRLATAMSLLRSPPVDSTSSSGGVLITTSPGFFGGLRGVTAGHEYYPYRTPAGMMATVGPPLQPPQLEEFGFYHFPTEAVSTGSSQQYQHVQDRFDRAAPPPPPYYHHFI